jgi:hypothetical protein|tara:strand:- start:54 stop:548 length:495 start_codon:yes stop_codon:yes gene_type:complete
MQKNKIKVVDNFLEDDIFIEIQNILMGDKFPWFFNNFKNDSEDIHNYQFTHTVVRGNGEVESKFIKYMKPFFNKLNIKKIYRIKINLTTRTEKLFNHIYHTDVPIQCTTAIFYVNSNNGKTIFKHGEEVDSISNRIVMFNSNLEHAATSHTDKKTRVVINLNYV